MDWNNDPELQQMFTDEVNGRASRLAFGAAAMLEDALTPDLVAEMVREAHTVKGTGKVMGYDEIASAGLLCERVWRWVQKGDVDPTAGLGRAFAAIAEALPEAAGGEADLISVMQGVHDVLSGTPLPEPLEPIGAGDDEPGSGGRPQGLVQFEADDPTPDSRATYDGTAVSETVPAGAAPSPVPRPPTVVEPLSAPEMDSSDPALALMNPAGVGLTMPAGIEEASDLGGLIGALESWALEESIAVGTGDLYRLINDVAALRVDLGAMSRTVESLAGRVTRGEVATAQDLRTVVDVLAESKQVASNVEQTAHWLASAPLGEVTKTLPQLVRYLGRKAGKDIKIEILGDDARIDRQVLDQVGDIIRQLIVNAVVHGIESQEERSSLGKPHTAHLLLEATAAEGRLEIVVADDGRGIDWKVVREAGVRRGLLPAESSGSKQELRALLFSPGFTTVEAPDELVGDGTGLAAVKTVVESLHGTFTLHEERGLGTTVTLSLPMRRALQKALLVVAGGVTWGLPEAAVIGSMEIDDADLDHQDGTATLERDGEMVPFSALSGLVGLEEQPAAAAVFLHSVVGTLAVGIERVIGWREVATKELGALLSGTSAVTGAALLGGGDVVLLVDAGRLVERQRDIGQRPAPAGTVLIVDDSEGVRQVVAAALASEGFDAIVAESVVEALAKLRDRTIDALVVDFSMPRADGVALVHMVRQKYGSLPIVMLSAVADEDDVQRAEQAGVDAFFSKSDLRRGGLAEKLRELID